MCYYVNIEFYNIERAEDNLGSFCLQLSLSSRRVKLRPAVLHNEKILRIEGGDVAGYENIKDHGFDKKTAEERRALAIKAGKASGEARRKKADFRRTLNMLLTTKIDHPEWTQALGAMGLDSTLESVVNAAMIREAMQGNVKAYEAIAKYSGQVAQSEQELTEQEIRIQKMEAEINAITPDSMVDGFKYNGIPSNMIAPAFAPVVYDIAEHEHTEYVFPGGRGSTKSSFISLEIIDLIENNDQMHAVVMRQVADTMRGSVYQQMLWAIDALGLSFDFHATVSPMEITRISTGQKIYFRGADDPGKLKSIKVPFGYIGILWLEELDQFTGPESVRKIEQSVIRGGDISYIFKSFNPPKSASNWANKYLKIPKESRLVTESTYLTVPKKWLGKTFLEEAEFLKAVNPTAYENEYMGVANGTGGVVFDNLTIREITNEEIQQFDRVYNGVDWGWYPDPYHFIRCHYDAARMRLYIFVEYRCNKKSNRETADRLLEMGITPNDLITCDSAENKSVGDYKAYGLLARSAEKGPGSVDYSMKWLQSLNEIVIDNTRCPEAATEFLEYEYERDKEGEIISGYPDKNNHAIDAVRYATNPIWKRRGQ